MALIVRFLEELEEGFLVLRDLRFSFFSFLSFLSFFSLSFSSLSLSFFRPSLIIVPRD